MSLPEVSVDAVDGRAANTGRSWSVHLVLYPGWGVAGGARSVVARAAGRILGLVGESGSGKSVTGFSILGLLDEPGRISGGQVLFKGRDLTKLPASQLRAIQGNRIAMIFRTR